MASLSKLRLRRYSLVAAVILIISVQRVNGVLSSSAPSPSVASLTGWTVPTPASGPWMLTLDQSGNCCWFSEYYGNKLAHFDSTTGSFQEWEIPTLSSNPYGISITTVNGRVMVWGTEFSSDKVFAFTPDSGQFHEYALPSGSGPGYISIERQSGSIRVWFTEMTRNRNGELVYDPSSGNVTFYDSPFPPSVGGGAYDVYAGSGYVWFAGFSSLVRWDRASGQYSIWPLPHNGSAVVRSIAFDSSGQLWYTQSSTKAASNDNFVGILHGNMVQDWRIPGLGSNPRAICISPLTQQPWIAEQSSIQGNGTLGNLNDFGNGTLSPSSPITAPSISTATILAATISHVSPSNYTVASTTSSIVATNQGPFTQYGLGSTAYGNVIADSTGNLWVSESEANKIVRLSPSTPDYALAPTSSYASIEQGNSILIGVTARSVSGYEGHVRFSALGLSRGVKISAFDPNPVYVPSSGNASSKLEISVATGTTQGIDSITIEGSDGAINHTIDLILTVTNSTITSSGQQLETGCLIAVPIYIPQSTLLIGLLIDVMTGAFYIGLPLEYFSRRIRPVQGLSRKSWLITLLLAPSLVSLVSAVLLIC